MKTREVLSDHPNGSQESVVVPGLDRDVVRKDYEAGIVLLRPRARWLQQMKPVRSLGILD